MPFSIVPPPYGPGGGNVTGGGDLNNADRVVIVAGTSEVGESDVTLTTGVFSRAGTVGLAATGANVITFSTNGSERGRWSSGGNLLVGTTTDDGSSKLQVQGSIRSNSNVVYANTFYASSNSGVNFGTEVVNGSLDFRANGTGSYAFGYNTGASAGAFNYYGGGTGAIFSISSAGTATLYNPTAVTGSTSLVVRAGEGQSTTALQAWQNNAGSQIAYISSAGAYVGPAAVIAPTASGASVTINRAGSGSANAGNWGLGIQNQSADDTLTIGYSSSTYTTGGVLGWVGNSMAFIYYPGELRLGTGVGANAVIRLTTGIGFFGVTPVAQQTATDITEVIAALQAYGLLT